MQLHAWMELNEMELLVQALHSVSKGFTLPPHRYAIKHVSSCRISQVCNYLNIS
jgi:hypothetical protein